MSDFNDAIPTVLRHEGGFEESQMIPAGRRTSASRFVG